MTMAPDLVLRDIHMPAAPPFWPPAPGWWAVAAAVVLVTLAITWWTRRRAAHRRRIAALFDDAITTAKPGAAQVAAISDLLRRAARRRDAGADRLQGEDWLRFLDAGLPAAPFSTGPGRVLLDGGFRRDVDDSQVAALAPIARARFEQWMGVRR